jgi:hypothetical protein
MKYIVTEKALTIFASDMQPYALLRSDPRWERALDALRSGDEEKLMKLMAPRELIDEYLETTDFPELEFDTDTRTLYVNGITQEIPAFITRQLYAYAMQDLPIEPLMRATYKLMKNPSSRIRNKLFEFLEYGNLPFTDSGNFVAYKKVTKNLLDIYTKTFVHTPGAEATMERHLVDDDPEHTCSTGLHACNFEYLSQFGSESEPTDRIVACEIDPADVVSIPIDYNNTKMRVCRYVVIGEVPRDSDVLRGRALYR